MQEKILMKWRWLFSLSSIFLAACGSVSEAATATLPPPITSNRTVVIATESPSMATPRPLLTSTLTPTQFPTHLPTDIGLLDGCTLDKSGYFVTCRVSTQEFDLYRNLMDPEPIAGTILGIYAHFQDDFDFVFVINNAEKDFDAPGNGITFALRPYPETGLGSLSNFPDSLPYWKVSTPLEHETKRLMTMIHFSHKHAIQKGPVLHEMMHRWGNFVLPGSEKMHWGFSNVGGQLGGFTDLEVMTNGTFHAYNRFRRDECFDPRTPSRSWDTRNSIPYAPLELYLMGLVGIDEVPAEITVLDSAGFVNEANCIVSGVEHVYEAKDLLQPIRQPGPADSQKRFKILTIVITSDPLTEEEKEYFVQQLQWFEHSGDDGDPSSYNFWEATGGRANVETGELTGSLKAEMR